MLNGIDTLEIRHDCSIRSDTFSLPVIQTHVTMEPFKIKLYPFSLLLLFTTWEPGFLMNVTLPSSTRLEPLPLNTYID